MYCTGAYLGGRSARARLVAVACLIVVASAIATAPARAVSTTSFQGSYEGFSPYSAWKWWQSDKCTEPQPIYASEPTTGGPFPVFVYLHGTLGDWGGNAEGQRVVAQAAAQGFLAVAFTYDSWLTEYAPSAIDAHANCMFSASEPQNAISQICARADANCSQGIAVSGFSQGGAIAARANNFSPLVRAAWLMGVNGPVIGQALAAPVGTRLLPNNRIRMEIGQLDAYGYTGATTPDLSALNAMTGRNCSTFSCLGTDGSGYYVVSNSEVADGVADHCYWESVNPYSPASSCSWFPTFDPGFLPPSTLPWSLTTNLNWLRAQLSAPATARDRRAAAHRPRTPVKTLSRSATCAALKAALREAKRRGLARQAEHRASRIMREARCPTHAR